MALPREQVCSGLLEEMELFEELVRSLDERQAATPSRCEGWTVLDVAAHFIGTMTDIANGRLEGQGTPEVTARQVEERRGRSAAELADELAEARKLGADLMAAFDDRTWGGPVVGGTFPGTLGDGVEALLYDAFVHGDDIRAAIGRPSVRTVGLAPSVSHVAWIMDNETSRTATLKLDGMPVFEVNGGGEELTGDPFDFVLAATGREDPAPLGLPADLDVYG
jgi:uncharacterized protein (TIGR03083 family)